ncbi:MAG: hypothetical protein ACYCQJ_02475 [Nitrososphaerales archaeon]
MNQTKMKNNDYALKWLLSSKDPSIKYLARRDLLDEEESHLASIRKEIIHGPRVRALLSGQKKDGGFGVDPYRKWIGSHWRLVSLVELAIPKENKQAQKAAEEVLVWLSKALLNKPVSRNGLIRKHASVYGNPLGVCSYLGLSEDPRVKLIANSLIEWQWPDGGWNCDASPDAHHSSFHESLATLWGLIQYQKATGDKEVSKSIRKVSELFLSHQLFKSHTSGEIVNPTWLKLHYPPYWHYDILQALRVVSLAGKINDPRTKESLDILESKQTKEGYWRAEGFYWHPMKKGNKLGGVDIVDWGRKGPNEMITLNALRVLKVSGRLSNRKSLQQN